MENRRFYPMLVFENAGDLKNVQGSYVARWRMFDTLPVSAQELLTSEELPAFLKKIEESHKCTPQATDEISRAVRAYFFKKASSREFAQRVAALLNIPYNEALRLHHDIKSIKIAVKLPEGQVKMTLKDALAKLPRIGSQRVTEAFISDTNSGRPVAPSVTNWIIFYEKARGVGARTSVDRAEFLYHNSAMKTLSNQGRSHLGELLGSFDADDLLLIDTNKEEIIWSAVTQAPVRRESHVKRNERIVTESSTRPQRSNRQTTAPHHVTPASKVDSRQEQKLHKNSSEIEKKVEDLGNQKNIPTKSTGVDPVSQEIDAQKAAHALSPHLVRSFSHARTLPDNIPAATSQKRDSDKNLTAPSSGAQEKFNSTSQQELQQNQPNRSYIQKMQEGGQRKQTPEESRATLGKHIAAEAAHVTPQKKMLDQRMSTGQNAPLRRQVAQKQSPQNTSVKTIQQQKTFSAKAPAQGRQQARESHISTPTLKNNSFKPTERSVQSHHVNQNAQKKGEGLKLAQTKSQRRELVNEVKPTQQQGVKPVQRVVGKGPTLRKQPAPGRPGLSLNSLSPRNPRAQQQTQVRQQSVTSQQTPQAGEVQKQYFTRQNSEQIKRPQPHVEKKEASSDNMRFSSGQTFPNERK